MLQQLMAKRPHLRSSHQRFSIKNGVLKNFTKFTAKHLCQSLLFNKVAGLFLQHTSERLFLSPIVLKIFNLDGCSQEFWICLCNQKENFSIDQYSVEVFLIIRRKWVMQAKFYLNFSMHNCEDEDETFRLFKANQRKVKVNEKQKKKQEV